MSYLTHFGLKRPPFSATPDPECWAPIPTMEAAFDQLAAAVETGQGIGLLTAPAGLGKTLLCRRLLDQFSNRFREAYLPTCAFSTRRAILQAVLYELGRPYAKLGEQELRLELSDGLLEISERCEGVLLVADEAHLLSEVALEELRAMTNHVVGCRPIVRLVLSGSLLLEEKLASPALQALNQRVCAHATLEPLTRAESRQYVEHRLSTASVARPLFTPDALETICHACDGIPRNLNHLCDYSLVIAARAGEHAVREASVFAALDQLKQLPLHWNVPASREHARDEMPQHSAAAQFAPPAPASEDAGNVFAVEFGAEPAAANAEFLPVSEADEEWVSSTNLCDEEPDSDDTEYCSPWRCSSAGADALEFEGVTAAHKHAEPATFEPPAGSASNEPDGWVDGFSEEPIVDRYALLDSGRRELPPIQADAEPRLHIPEAIEPNVVEYEEIAQQPRPAQWDVVCAEDCDDDDEDDDVRQLAEAVRQVYEESERLRREWPPQDETSAAQDLEARLSEIEFEESEPVATSRWDVVEPDAEVRIAEPVAEIPEAPPVRPLRPYQNLFSSLRRRQAG